MNGEVFSQISPVHKELQDTIDSLVKIKRYELIKPYLTCIVNLHSKNTYLISNLRNAVVYFFGKGMSEPEIDGDTDILLNKISTIPEDMLRDLTIHARELLKS